MVDLQIHALGLQEGIHGGGESRGALIQRPLQLRPLLAQVEQHGLGGSHGQGMPHEGTGKESDPGFRHGLVAVLPGSAVKGIHVGVRTGDHADRHSATDDLPVGRNVGLHAKPRLGPAGMDAEAGDDLVENQRGTSLLGNLAHRVQELLGLKLRLPALHGLHQYGGQRTGLRAQNLQGSRIAIRQHGDLAHHIVRNARRNGQRAELALEGLAFGEDLVVHPVVVARKVNNALASGDCARRAHRPHDRLGTRIAEGGPLLPGHLAEQPGDLARQGGLRADLDTLHELLFQGDAHELGVVPKQIGAKAHGDIEVLVAIQIPDLRAGGTAGDHRVGHLFPGHAEPGHGARIGKMSTVFLGVFLGARRLLGVARNQRVEVLLLTRREGIAGRRVDRRIRPVPGHRRRGRSRLLVRTKRPGGCLRHMLRSGCGRSRDRRPLGGDIGRDGGGRR